MSETLGKVQNVATDPKRLILRNSAEFGDPTYENAELEKKCPCWDGIKRSAFVFKIVDKDVTNKINRLTSTKLNS